MSNFNSLLPRNSTALEKAIEQACGQRCENINFDYRRLYDPANCPLEYLPYLAWAYRVPVWSEKWPEQRQRDTIAQSILINRKAGTPWSITSALALARINVDLIEWWQKHPHGSPHTFSVDISLNKQLPGRFRTPKSYTRLQHILGEYKPVRAHYDISVNADMTTGVAIATTGELDANIDSKGTTAPVQPRPIETGVTFTSPAELSATLNPAAKSKPVQPRPANIAPHLSTVAQMQADIRAQSIATPVQPRPIDLPMNLMGAAEISAEIASEAMVKPVQPRPVRIGNPVTGLLVQLCATIKLGCPA